MEQLAEIARPAASARWARVQRQQRVWNALLIMLLLADLILLPFYVCRLISPPAVSLIATSCIFEFLFLLDFINLLLPLRPRDNGEGAALLRKLDRKYVRKRMVWDLIALIPVDLIALACGMGAQPVAALRMPKVLRIVRASGILREWRRRSLLFRGDIFGIGEQVVRMLLICHWLGCFWFFVGCYPRTDAPNAEWSWVTVEYEALVREISKAAVLQLDPSEASIAVDIGTTVFAKHGWATWYLKSLYWAVTTMTTVGYGDFAPLSQAEMGFAILVIFWGSVLYAYLFGIVATFVSQLDSNAQLFRTKLAVFETFLKAKRLSKQSRSRVLDFCEHLWKETRAVDETRLLRSLPASIADDLTWHLYRDALSALPMFEGVETSFMLALTSMLVSHVFPPLEIVVLEGEIGREMYFIEQGKELDG